MKSKQEPNNCITCGVDLNHCADKDLERNQCGFCSPKKTEYIIFVDGKEWKRTPIYYSIICSVITTFLVSLSYVGIDGEHPVFFIMLMLILTFVGWNYLFSNSVIEKKYDKRQISENV